MPALVVDLLKRSVGVVGVGVGVGLGVNELLDDGVGTTLAVLSRLGVDECEQAVTPEII